MPDSPECGTAPNARNDPRPARESRPGGRCDRCALGGDPDSVGDETVKATLGAEDAWHDRKRFARDHRVALPDHECGSATEPRIIAQELAVVGDPHCPVLHEQELDTKPDTDGGFDLAVCLDDINDFGHWQQSPGSTASVGSTRMVYPSTVSVLPVTLRRRSAYSGPPTRFLTRQWWRV